MRESRCESGLDTGVRFHSSWLESLELVAVPLFGRHTTYLIPEGKEAGVGQVTQALEPVSPFILGAAAATSGIPRLVSLRNDDA